VELKKRNGKGGLRMSSDIQGRYEILLWQVILRRRRRGKERGVFGVFFVARCEIQCI